MACGVYEITNIINGKKYIGSSINLEHRRNSHFWERQSSNPHLQASMTKYGKENFAWRILEECSPDIMLEREQFYINQYDPRNLYNICLVAGNSLGIRCTNETKEKIRLAKKGTRLSDEHKRKISLSNMGHTSYWLGKHLSKEHKEKLRQMGIGKKRTEEQRVSISISKTGRSNPNFGKTASLETKEKMRKSQIARRKREQDERTV